MSSLPPPSLPPSALPHSHLSSTSSSLSLLLSFTPSYPSPRSPLTLLHLLTFVCLWDRHVGPSPFSLPAADKLGSPAGVVMGKGCPCPQGPMLRPWTPAAPFLDLGCCHCSDTRGSLSPACPGATLDPAVEQMFGQSDCKAYRSLGETGSVVHQREPWARL